MWPTIRAINKAFPMGLPVNNEERLKQLAAGFCEHSGGLLDESARAVDVSACSSTMTFC
jgi:hypothetical protein